MKCLVIFFHKNILDLYKRTWIDKCINSIKTQTFKEYDVFELDYSGRNINLCNGIFDRYIFESKSFDNHIHAMNYIINKSFTELGYDVIFNTNMDDYFHETRFEKQLEHINLGSHLISSNFYYISENMDGVDEIINNLDMVSHGDIGVNLGINHNIIAHPCVCMHKDFWDKDLNYNDLLGYEDIDLWKRAHDKGKKFHILKDYLLYYRIHEQQVTKTYNNNGS